MRLDISPEPPHRLAAGFTLEQAALLTVSVVFLGVLLWRVRPMMPLTRLRDREALRSAREKVEKASTPEARAQALCEAGELCAQRGRRVGAEGFFRRALAEAPSANVVGRAAAALAPWPRAAEAVLWKTLATSTSAALDREVLQALVSTLEQNRQRRSQAAALRRVLERLS